MGAGYSTCAPGEPSRLRRAAPLPRRRPGQRIPALGRRVPPAPGRQRPGEEPGEASPSTPRRPGPRGGPTRREGALGATRLLGGPSSRKGPQGKRLPPGGARARFPPSSGLEPRATTSGARSAPQPPRSRGHPGCACRRFPCGWPRAVIRRALGRPRATSRSPRFPKHLRTGVPPSGAGAGEPFLATTSFDHCPPTLCRFPPASRGGTNGPLPVRQPGIGPRRELCCTGRAQLGRSAQRTQAERS